MARIDLFEIEGFAALNKKLKQLPDNIKRKEVLAIQRKIANPIRKKYEDNLPKRKGTLGKSVAVQSVRASKVEGNPAIQIAPGKRGKNDGYYKFMVTEKGAKPGSNKRGSRKGLNTVTKQARDKTLRQVQSGAVKENEVQVAKLIQKKIDNLSI